MIPKRKERDEARKHHPQRSHLGKETRRCRFCLEANEDEMFGKLIDPCLCFENLKFVHIQCLKNFIVEKSINIATAKCEICQVPYKMNFKVSEHFSPSQAKTTESSSFCFMVFLLVISILVLLSDIFLLVFFIIQSVTQDEDSDKGEFTGTKAALLIFLLVLSAFLGVLGYFAYKHAFFRIEINKWDIERLDEKELAQKGINIEDHYQSVQLTIQRHQIEMQTLVDQKREIEVQVEPTRKEKKEKDTQETKRENNEKPKEKTKEKKEKTQETKDFFDNSGQFLVSDLELQEVVGKEESDKEEEAEFFKKMSKRTFSINMESKGVKKAVFSEEEVNKMEQFQSKVKGSFGSMNFGNGLKGSASGIGVFSQKILTSQMIREPQEQRHLSSFKLNLNEEQKDEDRERKKSMEPNEPKKMISYSGPKEERKLAGAHSVFPGQMKPQKELVRTQSQNKNGSENMRNFSQGEKINEEFVQEEPESFLKKQREDLIGIIEHNETKQSLAKKDSYSSSAWKQNDSFEKPKKEMARDPSMLLRNASSTHKWNSPSKIALRNLEVPDEKDEFAF